MMSEYICEELIAEIFTRLPIEAILRFRTLSKSIRSCIDSPHFIRKHTLLSPQKFLIRHRNRTIGEGYTLHSEDQLPLRGESIDATALKFPFSSTSKIVGSCNGIFCLRDSKDKSISLWNPCIRRKLTIPDRRPASKCKLPCICIGFGFDPITSDYKILRISYEDYDHKRPRPPQAFIYSVRRDAWCHIDSSPPPNVIMSEQACCLNGALLLWVVQNSVGWHKSEEEEKYTNAYIMTFDLTTHVFGSIELPADQYWENQLWHTHLFLTIINGSIAFIHCADNSSIRIWVRRLVDNNTAWSLEFDVPTFDNLIRHSVTKFVGVTKNGNFLFLCNGQCVAYDHASGMESSIMKNGFNSVDMEMCVESLQLLNIALPYKESIISHYL
uniref:putative F-box protein At3g16210 n=1 Tax=Erigeron canadensis TaxID=72917 RepID=UPI001CB9A723|nr:putative F-box protein At3g16210 [Erigeron canadensis]